MAQASLNPYDIVGFMNNQASDNLYDPNSGKLFKSKSIFIYNDIDLNFNQKSRTKLLLVPCYLREVNQIK